MSYRRLGDMVRFISNKNIDGNATVLFGINIDKFFMPSVANIIGVDLSKYKLVKKYQFACNRMHVGRDARLPISMSTFDYDFIVSPAYDVFEVTSSEVLPEYLMLWFRRKEFDRQCWFYTDADVRGGLHLDALKSIEIKVPSIEQQRQIVAQYQSITNKIKVNEQICEKLEATAQALYKHWFVDFEFPYSPPSEGCPQDGVVTGKPYKSSGGKMVWNEELGKEIPEGWENTRLSNIVEIKDGTHDSPNPTTTGFPLVTSTHLNHYDISFDKTYNISKEDFTQTNKRSKVDKYDILFSMIGTVGLVNYVLYNEVNFAIKNVGLFKTSAKKEISEYLLFFLKSDYMKQYIATNSSGSTQSYITLGFLRDIEILFPSKNIILRFEKKVKIFVELIENKVIETQKLTQLQSLLLSRLAVGEEARV